MNCPNCNAQLEEGVKFCTHCGTPMQQPEQPQYQQPVYQQPQYQQPVYQPRPDVSKKEYLAQYAPQRVRSNANLVTILMLVAIALIIGGIVVCFTTSIFEIPVVSTMLTFAEADPQELVADLDDQLYELEADYQDSKPYMSAEEQVDAEKLMDALRSIVDSFSVMNIRSAMAVVEEVNENRDLGIDTFELESINALVTGIIVVVVSMFVLPLLFVLLGGLLKNTPLTILGIVFTFFSQLPLCSGLFTVLTLAALIVQAVFCTKVNGPYKNFKNGIA